MKGESAHVQRKQNYSDEINLEKLFDDRRRMWADRRWHDIDRCCKEKLPAFFNCRHWWPPTIRWGERFPSLLTKKCDGVNVSAETSGGSAENVRLIEQGFTDMAWANASEMYWGWNGIKYFKDKKYQKMRVIGRAWSNHYHWLALKSSKITNVMQFKGKKITIGPQGSGAALHGETLLRTLGLWDDVKIVWMPPSAASNALKDKQTDVFGYFSGIPMAAVLDIQALNRINLIDVTGEAMAKGFCQQYPFYRKAVIPAGTYKDQNQEIGIFEQSTYWICSEDLPDDLVYKMVKTVYSKEGIAYMANSHKRGSEFSVEGGLNGVEGLIPVHPGAAKFWKEQGLTVPAISK